MASCETCRYWHAFSVEGYGGNLTHRCQHWLYIDGGVRQETCELWKQLEESEAQNRASLLSLSYAEWLYAQRKALLIICRTP